MSINVVAVDSTARRKLFNQFTRDLYAKDPEFISHLDRDIDAIFNSKKNTAFIHGGAARWLAYDSKQLVGKVAAFYNEETHQYGIGFFDSVDSQEVATSLFDTAIAWLREHGASRVEAPVNFGERDKYWGLMVDGIKSPSYQENYNAAYYKVLFENYGFTKTIEQTTSEATPEAIDYEKYKRFTDRLEQRGGFRAEHFTLSQIGKFVADFTTIYNEAWAQHEHFVPFTTDRVMKLFVEMKPIIREDILWFLYQGDKPIAFYLSVIDVNQIFKHVNGNMNLWGKLKFLWYRHSLKIDKIRGIIFGVIPEFQDKGVYSILIMKMYKVMREDADIQRTELAWIGDFNPKMHALFDSLGAVKTKVHYTYEKLL